MEIPAEAAPGQGCAEAMTAVGPLAVGQANAGPRLVEPLPAETFRVHEAVEVRLPAATAH